MRISPRSPLVLSSVLIFLGGCQDGAENPLQPEAEQTRVNSPASSMAWHDQAYEFSPPVFDIDAAPDGSILLAENQTIKEIRRGEVAEIDVIPAVENSPLNGLETTGRGSFFATSGGLDLAYGAGVWHVSHGRPKLVGDIEAFETMYDPDAFEGPMWKNQLCEEDGDLFSAGPQSNPYHLTSWSGGEALIADAAGNSLLSVGKNGKVDWVAVFTPPVDGAGDWLFLKTAESDPSVECYVQPVPTSVAVGSDRALYVGELTGAPPVPGRSRVWKIKPGARHVSCPSQDCEVFADGFTSIIDVEFGPDEMLYVVEYDADTWIGAFSFGTPGFTPDGRISRCDPGSGVCEVVASELPLPSAITFDKWGNLWLLEKNSFAPTVRVLDLE